MDNTKNNTGLGIYTAGILKQFQQFRQWIAPQRTVATSYSNYLPFFVTPKLPNGVSIVEVRLFEISGNWQLAKTYDEFILHRNIGTALSGIDFNEITLNTTKVFEHKGRTEISTLNSGVYELQLTVSNNLRLESDLFCVDSTNTGAAQIAYALQTNGIVMSKDGITPTIWAD